MISSTYMKWIAVPKRRDDFCGCICTIKEKGIKQFTDVSL